MQRITVNVDDDTHEWLKEEADELGVSKAHVGGHCIKMIRNSVDYIDLQQNEVPEGKDPRYEYILTRLGALENTVNALRRNADLESEDGDDSEDDDSDDPFADIEVPDHDEMDSRFDIDPDDRETVDLEDLPDRGESGTTTSTAESSQDTGGDGGDHGDHERDALYERAETVLADLDVPGVSERTETTRRKAILYAWAELRDRGTAESRELANAAFDAFDEDDLGYSSARRYRGYGLWDGCLRNALKQLPGVNSPPERGSQWRFGLDHVDESG